MTTTRIAFHPDFSDDLADAAEYFLEKIPHRLDDLLGDYDNKLDDILRDPELYAVRAEDGLRRANLDVFSYSIRYHWSGDQVTVLAFAHHHQHTARWIHRLAEIRRR